MGPPVEGARETEVSGSGIMEVEADGAWVYIKQQRLTPARASVPLGI